MHSINFQAQLKLQTEFSLNSTKSDQAEQWDKTSQFQMPTVHQLAPLISLTGPASVLPAADLSDAETICQEDNTAHHSSGGEGEEEQKEKIPQAGSCEPHLHVDGSA